jgi:hypothetical protein
MEARRVMSALKMEQRGGEIELDIPHLEETLGVELDGGGLDDVLHALDEAVVLAKHLAGWGMGGDPPLYVRERRDAVAEERE